MRNNNTKDLSLTIVSLILWSQHSINVFKKGSQDRNEMCASVVCFTSNSQFMQGFSFLGKSRAPQKSIHENWCPPVKQWDWHKLGEQSVSIGIDQWYYQRAPTGNEAVLLLLSMAQKDRPVRQQTFALTPHPSDLPLSPGVAKRAIRMLSWYWGQRWASAPEGHIASSRFFLLAASKAFLGRA